MRLNPQLSLKAQRLPLLLHRLPPSFQFVRLLRHLRKPRELLRRGLDIRPDNPAPAEHRMQKEIHNGQMPTHRVRTLTKQPGLDPLIRRLDRRLPFGLDGRPRTLIITQPQRTPVPSVTLRMQSSGSARKPSHHLGFRPVVGPKELVSGAGLAM